MSAQIIGLCPACRGKLGQNYILNELPGEGSCSFCGGPAGIYSMWPKNGPKITAVKVSRGSQYESERRVRRRSWA